MYQAGVDLISLPHATITAGRKKDNAYRSHAPTVAMP